MSDYHPAISDHPFQPYLPTPEVCGYTEGDVVCGFSEAEHKAS